MKQRFVALTDIYRLENDKQKEIDDVESMIRLMLYANDIEGLIATSSFCLKHGGTESEKQVILDIINAYEKVLPNLKVHSKEYPDADYLRSITRHGIPEFGKRKGKGFAEKRFNDNEGVQLIADILQKEDTRPVWFGLWGGCNTLAQAIWMLSKTCSENEFDKIIRKVRIYGISDQDKGGIWLRQAFGDRLFYIVSPSNGSGNTLLNGGGFLGATWTGMCWDGYSMGEIDKIKVKFKAADRDLITTEWLKENIIGDTPFRKIYPLPVAALEGDTPTYLGLIPNGLNNMEHPDYGSWGGRYEYKIPEKKILFGVKEKFPIWTDCEDTFTGKNGVTVKNSECTLYRWREAVQNDFAARMAWTDSSDFANVNHPPKVKIDCEPIRKVKRGDTITISAKGSTDPDGDKLNYKWYCYKEAGTVKQNVIFHHENTDTVQITCPDENGDIHIILEVTDCGSPNLTSYARIILKCCNCS